MSEFKSPKIFLEWQSYAVRKVQKSPTWYAAMGMLLGIFILYDLWTGGWIVSVTMLILAGVYYFFESRPVPVLTVQITEFGVQYGKEMYTWDTLKAFWVFPESKTLHVKAQKGVLKEISIFLPEEVNIQELREYLSLHIPEDREKKESFSDQLIRNLGL